MTSAPHNTDTPFTADLIERFNRFTHFPKSLEKENAIFAEESRKERVASEATLKRAGITAVPEAVEQALERVRRARYEAFVASVRSRELAPPWSVVGPANYHKHARPERANRINERAMEILAKARESLARELDRLFPSAVIRSDAPDAAQRLQAEIDDACRLQEKMKAVNRIVRKAGLTPEQKVAELQSECGFDEARAIALLKPDFAGRTGFADYRLANNSANIRRMQARLRSVQREAIRPSMAVPFEGGRVEDDAAACRVRIFHDAKPPRIIIEQLKANGFHWSFNERCWQRLRNPAARAAAAEVTGIVWPAVSARHPMASPASVAVRQNPPPGLGMSP